MNTDFLTEPYIMRQREFNTIFIITMERHNL